MPEQVEIHTKPFVGRDGVTYHLFTLFESGRGWTAFNSYATANGKPAVLRGAVSKYGLVDDHDLVQVQLDAPSLKVKVENFSRRPYVSRKTGHSNPHLPKYWGPQTISTVYGCHGGYDGIPKFIVVKR